MIEHWQKKLGLEEWTIDTRQIDPASVTYPDDCVGDDRFFIGIMPQEESLYATIFHDRPLTEEDIVHELLHVRHPTESEEWVNNETTKQMTITEIDALTWNVPDILTDVFSKYDEDEDPYKEMERLRTLALEVGYDFDYGLSGEPTHYWKLNK